jgi:hypothetical protein
VRAGFRIVDARAPPTSRMPTKCVTMARRMAFTS